MQDPNADTEWNDVLRSKGVLPPKETEISEEDVVDMLEKTVQQKAQGKQIEDMTLDELDDKEDEMDEEEERIFEEYRRQRIAEMRAVTQASKFGEVMEITKADYVREVNEAGEGIWVILHVYKQGMPICNLMNHHFTNLARKFPQAKFIKSVSSVCIPNYPDKNLPTVFVYYEGQMKKQWVGPLAFGGMNLTQDQLEWMLAQIGAMSTELESPPKREIKDVMNTAIRESAINRDDESDDDGY